MTIPIHHSPGDLEHTEDHNSIVDVLTDHETDLIVLQNQITALPSSFMSKSGNNVVQISNPAGYGTSYVIPPGTRDSGAYAVTGQADLRPGLLRSGTGRFGAGCPCPDGGLRSQQQSER